MGHLTGNPSAGRGCGTRTPGGVYLCVGTSIFGKLKVENLVKDPGIPWPYELSRAPKILPRNPKDPNSINDVYKRVGMNDYPILPDFAEEVRYYGLSQKVSPTFPFEKLTPGKSKIRLIFPRGIFKLGWELDGKPDEDCHPNCKMKQKMFSDWIDNPPQLGHHPSLVDGDDWEGVDYEKLAFEQCTFGLWGFGPKFHYHNSDLSSPYGGESPEIFKVHFPSKNKCSFTYETTEAIVASPANETREKLLDRIKDLKNWIPAIQFEVPISHIEFPEFENKKAKQAANKIGYETVVTEW
jgi:hypothetical protein